MGTPRQTRAVSLALALASAVLASPRPCHADPTGATASPVDEARARFQRGVKFAKDGDFRSALVEFEEAYRIAPNFKVRFNIGQTCEELQDFAGAMAAFRAYLAEGGSAVPKARRSVVEDELKQLEGHVARLEVESVEPDVELVAEGDRKLNLGKTPLADVVLLNSGTWEVTARKEGFEPQVTEVTVAGGDRKKVVVALKKLEPPRVVVALPPPPAPVPAPAPPPVAHAPSMVPVYIGAGLTGVLAISAGVTGGFFLGAKSTYESKLGDFGVTKSAVSDASDSAKTLAIAADVQTVAAVAVGAGTLIVYLVRRPSHAASTGWAPLLSPTAVGVRGTF
jgi:hypothetical protein